MPSKRAVSSRLSLGSGLTASGNKKSPGTRTTSRLSTCGASESKCQASAQPQPGTGSQRQDVRVNVCVRVRPLNKLELRTKQIDAWSYENNEIFQTYVPSGHGSSSGKKKRQEAGNFAFDKVFVPEDRNEDVHHVVGTRVVEYVMKGFHGCLFAYGQTSAGKTYTIHGNETDRGILPRSINLIFKHIEDQPSREFILRVSFFEIYNEVVNDLLAPENINLRIREDRKRGVFVSGLKEEVVMSPEQVLALLAAGQSHRHVGRTNFNEASSRSHTVFRLVVESAEKTSNSRNQRSCLNIVDLAGSENAVKAGSGSRIKETGYINKSLLTLGHVIKRLSSEKKSAHIPYRNSKLTRILQNSLCGQAVVAVICCISPSSHNLEETLSTLKFASRAKRLKASVKVNYDEETLLKQYRNEIERLKKEVRQLRRRASSLASSSSESESAERRSSAKARISTQSSSSSSSSSSTCESRDSKNNSKPRCFSDNNNKNNKNNCHLDDDLKHIVYANLDAQDESIRNKQTRIEQLKRIILKSSKVKIDTRMIPEEVNQVMTRKLKNGVISLDEYTHIRGVITRAKNEEVEEQPELADGIIIGTRSNNILASMPLLTTRTRRKKKKTRSLSGSRRPAKHEGKGSDGHDDGKRSNDDDVNFQLVTRLKDINKSQSEEISRLRAENTELRQINAEKDEALHEWDMYYQSLVNKQPEEGDSDSLAAQLLAAETNLEEERVQHAGIVAGLKHQLLKAKGLRRRSVLVHRASPSVELSISELE